MHAKIGFDTAVEDLNEVCLFSAYKTITIIITLDRQVRVPTVPGNAWDTAAAVRTPTSWGARNAVMMENAVLAVVRAVTSFVAGGMEKKCVPRIACYTSGVSILNARNLVAAASERGHDRLTLP